MLIRLLMQVCFCMACASCTFANKFGEGEFVTHTISADIPWVQLPDGRAIAAVHGEMASGEHISYIRFPAGMRTAIHTHSSTYTGLIVQGVGRHFEPDTAEVDLWLPAGSFYRVPANVPHISECSDEFECIFAIHQHASFDRRLVN